MYTKEGMIRNLTILLLFSLSFGIFTDIDGNAYETVCIDSKTWNVERYSSGVYIIRMKAGDFMLSQKLMLVR